MSRTAIETPRREQRGERKTTIERGLASADGRTRQDRLRLVASVAGEKAACATDHRAAVGKQGSARKELSERLCAGREELEALLLERVRAVGAPPGCEDAGYSAVTPAVVHAGFEECLLAIASGPPIESGLPDVIAHQARAAAQRGIGADTLVRRFFAGHDAIQTVLVEHALELGITSATGELKAVRGDVSALFEALVAGVAAEHARECERISGSPAERITEVVRRLLAGEHVEHTALGYAIDERWHLGVIARGAEARKALTGLAAHLGLSLLAAEPGDGCLWAWLGAGRRLPMTEIEQALSADAEGQASFAIGVPGAGLEGFRQSHAQALGAMTLSQHVPARLTRYAANPLLASALCDEPLCAFLGEMIARLGDTKASSVGTHETLRAYFDAGLSASGAADLLHVSRHTVLRRVADAEALLGRPLRMHLTELQLALHLHELGV